MNYKPQSTTPDILSAETLNELIETHGLDAVVEAAEEQARRYKQLEKTGG